MRRSHGVMSFIGALFLMAALTVMLVWVPVPMLGPFLAGVVGGWCAERIGTAILAVFTLCVTMALLAGIGAGFFSGHPAIGVATGVVGFALLVMYAGGLLAGAIVGALIVVVTRPRQ